MQITVGETTTKAVWVIHHTFLEEEQAACIHADVYVEIFQLFIIRTWEFLSIKKLLLYYIAWKPS